MTGRMLKGNGRCAALIALLALAGNSVAAAPAATATPVGKAAQAVRETDEQAFARIDKNADRMISLDEFKAELQARRQRLAVQRLRRQFQTMDSDRSGGLDTVEFSQLRLVKNAGSKAPAFVAVDSNHDKKLDFAEYVALVSRYAPAQPAAGRQP